MVSARRYQAVERDLDAPEWDLCPECGRLLTSKGESDVDGRGRWEDFVCENACDVREVIVRSPSDDDSQEASA